MNKYYLYIVPKAESNIKPEGKTRKWLIIASLVVSGELIFGLPFHIARFYRPFFLDVFQISNAKLGDAIAVYGIMAMLAYFPSGVIADRFSARKLMSLSLCATSAGGLVLVSIPGQFILSLLYGFWGITTILLFWSAMMRATREWGGALSQGKAFGLLDGGRGLVASAAASLGVVLIAFLLADQFENNSAFEKLRAFQALILYYSFLTFAAAIVIWFVIPETKMKRLNQNSFVGIKEVLLRRTTWLQAFIVVCAYCGYKGLDFYGQFGTDVLGMDEVEASRFVSNASYLRPLAAIGAGFIADRFSSRKTLVVTFLVIIISYLFSYYLKTNAFSHHLILANLLLTFMAVYALRGVYFALFEETKVPRHLTGTTVGIVSLVGFTPDIFFNSIAGRILDSFPGEKGYQYFFLLLAVFSVVGLLSSIFLIRNKKL